MKKLLTILAISTITIVPSVTLVSCFNETTPKYFTFDDKDPIGSINKAIANRNLILSAYDFNPPVSNSDIKEGETNTSSIVYEISNSFTKTEDKKAARDWLRTATKDINTDNVKSGEVFAVELSSGMDDDKKTVIKFNVQDGYSFNWLKNNKTEQETFFLVDNDKKDFSTENNEDSIKVLSHLIIAFNKYKDEKTESGKLMKEVAAMNIYSSLISQTISKVQSESIFGQKVFSKLNSSAVIFNEDNDKEKMHFFTKNSPSSIADFITQIAKENEEQSSNKDEDSKIVKDIQKLIENLENDKEKEGVIISTNFFNFVNDVKEESTNEQYKFKITIK